MINKVKKESLTENTIIGSRKITSAEFRKFFEKTLGEDYEKYPVIHSFIKVPLNHKGKYLKEIIEECFNPSGTKSLESILSERRFGNISESDKVFIVAFNKAMNEMEYEYNIIGNKDYIIIAFEKTNPKSRPAYFHIDNNDNIGLRLFMTKIDAHRQFIENAPTHIKNLFTSEQGRCTGCSFRDGKCKYNVTKTYTIDGHLVHKCEFVITNLTVENIPDYIDLLSEFYLKKKSKRTE